MANDPNTIQYVIQEDGFWYIASKEKNPYVPYITVSAKGVANGLSTEYNDGYDFGPDSYNPSVTSGVPLTQTSGFLEAWDYSQNIGLANGGHSPVISFTAGSFDITAATTLNFVKGGGSPTVIGSGSGIGTYINCKVNDAYALTINPANGTGYNIVFNGLVPIYPSGYTPYGFLNADFSTANAGSNTFISYDLNIGNSGWGQSAVYLDSFQSVLMFNFENYSGGNDGLTVNNSLFEIHGGFINGNMSLSSCNYVYIEVVNLGTTIKVGNITTLIAIGGSPHFVLTGDIQNIYLGATILNPYDSGTVVQSVSSTIYNIGNLICEGVYYDYTNSMDFIGSGITLGNVDIKNVIDVNGTLTLPILTTTVSGTTAGSFVASMPERNNKYKKVLIYLDGYENDSTTAQTYTYPVPFSTVAEITANTASVPVVSTSLTEFSVAPDTTTAYTGIIVIEGY
jgi:hypothetical protein